MQAHDYLAAATGTMNPECPKECAKTADVTPPREEWHEICLAAGDSPHYAAAANAVILKTQ